MPSGGRRRTSSIDTTFAPESGKLVLVGRVRDQQTDTDATVHTTATDTMVAEVDFLSGRRVTSLSVSPEDLRVQNLIGLTASGGFRRGLAEAMPDRTADRDRLHLLLDDIPVVVLISGNAVRQQMPVDTKGELSSFVGGAGYCAGFAETATMMTTFRAEGHIPTPTGPPAPPITDNAKPGEWHRLSSLEPHQTRRLRRIDVLPGTAGITRIDAMFRDSCCDADGRETVIHEYQLTADLRTTDLALESLTATPRVLPWVECPAAVASASRLVGRRLPDVSDMVRTDLRGTSTCTHLNDLLRSIADAEALLRWPIDF